MIAEHASRCYSYANDGYYEHKFNSKIRKATAAEISDSKALFNSFLVYQDAWL